MCDVMNNTSQSAHVVRYFAAKNLKTSVALHIDSCSYQQHTVELLKAAATSQNKSESE